MKKLITLILLLLLTSCTTVLTGKAPIYDLPYATDPNAPPIWKLGWQHGCYSGFSAFGNEFYKSQYKFTQDMRYVRDETYFKGWMDAFNYCRAYVNRSLAGDELSYEENPTLFSTKSLDITTGNKRDDPRIYKTGFFSGRSNEGFFSSMFDVKIPGYGSTAWGASADECDWLNRCGADKPKDPIDALIGK